MTLLARRRETTPSAHQATFTTRTSKSSQTAASSPQDHCISKVAASSLRFNIFSHRRQKGFLAWRREATPSVHQATFTARTGKSTPNAANNPQEPCTSKVATPSSSFYIFRMCEKSNAWVRACTKLHQARKSRCTGEKIWQQD